MRAKEFIVEDHTFADTGNAWENGKKDAMNFRPKNVEKYHLRHKYRSHYSDGYNVGLKRRDRSINPETGKPYIKFGPNGPITTGQGVAEGQENFNGIDISMEIQKDDEYVDDEDYDNQVIYVTASSKGKELGHVLFAFDGEYLMPQDLEVEERYRGQGIAQTMYDYVKSKGYKIRRSGQQTDAGTGFWDKHKPGKNVWEQGVAEGSQEINWVKPNFDFEWHEVEEQSRMKQVPDDVRQYYQKHFPNKDAWLKAVQNGKAVVVPPDHTYEIRNAPFDKASLQKVLAPTGHEGPIGPAKEKRVNDLFDKGQVEMPIILKTSQGLWLIGGKTRLGTANYVKGLPAKVWLISGEQGVAEGTDPDKKYTIKKSYTMSKAGVEKAVWYIMDGDFVVDVTDLRRDAKYYADKWNAAEKESSNASQNPHKPGVAEGSQTECPPATQDITLNLKNRQKAIDEYGYGPLNPDMPNTKFWMKKVDEWNLDSAEEAKQSLCGNCAAFDQRQHTLDCIAQGIDSDNPEDAEGIIDAGELGYCKFLKFKCASRRTCDAWVTGGPLVDKQSDSGR